MSTSITIVYSPRSKFSLAKKIIIVKTFLLRTYYLVALDVKVSQEIFKLFSPNNADLGNIYI